MIVVIVLEGRDARFDARDRVTLGSGGPLRVDRLDQPEQPQIQRQVADVKVFAVFAEIGARRKQQAARHTGRVQAVEIPELDPTVKPSGPVAPFGNTAKRSTSPRSQAWAGVSVSAGAIKPAHKSAIALDRIFIVSPP